MAPASLFDGTNLDILFANEDTTVLAAGFSGFEPFTDRDIAQLVMRQDEILINHYVANVTVRFFDGTTEQFSASDAIIPNYVPAPASAVLISAVSCSCRDDADPLRRDRTARRLVWPPLPEYDSPT